MRKKSMKKGLQQVYLTLVLLVLALVAITAATVAWFSIADTTRVQTMNLEVISGVDLRIDVEAHADFDSYTKTLLFSQIAEKIRQEQGFSVIDTHLEPVTTVDAKTFTYEDGKPADPKTGAYLEYTLHFMAGRDMYVHLTSDDSAEGAYDGTAILSKEPTLPEAMRISFTVDGKTFVYDPGLGGTYYETDAGLLVFGLPESGQMVYEDYNTLFFAKEGIDKAVVVHVWLEGTDPSCNNTLKAADYAIRLRFFGTNEDNQPYIKY